MKQRLRFLFPAGSTRRKVVKKLLTDLHLRNYTLASYYNTWHWQQHQRPSLQVVQSLEDGPKISIVVPAYNTPKRHFLELIYSVVAQAYPNWELVIVNASDKKPKFPHIADAASIDKRIRVIDTANKGISANTNLGIEATTGSFVAFCDHDDLLDPWALYYVVAAIQEAGAELIYSDEDKVSDDSQTYFDPHYKPDWSPDLLTHVNYINHLTVVKKSLLEKVGKLDVRKDGAQDYDLLLRLTDEKPVIYHVPKVLYHWRAALTSTAQNFDSKSNVTKAGVSALSEHFARQGLATTKVTAKPDRPGFYTVQLKPYPKVSIIILPFASNALLRLYLELLFLKTDISRTQVELIVPPDVDTRDLPKEVQVVVLSSAENYLKTALSTASHEQVVLLGQIVLPVKDDWLGKLSGLLRLDHVIAATPLIIRQGAIIEDSGLIKITGGQLRPLFHSIPYLNNQTFFGNADWVRNVDALTGNVVLTKKSDLLKSLKTEHGQTSYQNQIQMFTAQRPSGTCNVVYSEVLFDTLSIRLRPRDHQVSFYNPNLVELNNGYELYITEAAAMSLLLQEKEAQEGKVL